jgi:hypothetical protein
MDSLMFKLLCSIDIEDATEMLRELRELSEMSPSEREIYCLLNEDAFMIAEATPESFIESREEILSILN